MKPKTEELLYVILWASEMFCRPTYRNLSESFEGWAYRNGFLRQLQRLERKQWLEVKTNGSGDRLHRLTEQGRVLSLGGRDPEVCWARPWDGHWRLALFDVPEVRKIARYKLRRYLRGLCFGCLQNSVWVTPDPVHAQRELLAKDSADVSSLILVEGRPCSGESDSEIVAAAWDFEEINSRYTRCQEVLRQRPCGKLENGAVTSRFQSWLNEERSAWQDAMKVDPLLPEKLLPVDYSGRKTWALRKEIMSKAGQQMREFPRQ